MPDYSKTIIYKICSKDPNITDIYVGSTCNFARRKCEHKSDCNTEAGKDYNHKVYKYIRENGGFDAFDMVPIEKLSCKDKVEKAIRERYWFEKLRATLNTDYPNRTKKEYRRDNFDIIKAHKGCKIVCECGKSVSRGHIARHNISQKHIKFIQSKPKEEPVQI